MSSEGELRIRAIRLGFGAITCSWSPSSSTRVASATCTCARSSGSVGRTSTTVSERSLATIWTSAKFASTVTAIGVGVGKVFMVFLSFTVPIR